MVLEKARSQSRGLLDDYEGAFGSGAREETIKLLQKYIVSVRAVMEHLEEHQRQFSCKSTLPPRRRCPYVCICVQM